MAKKIVDDYIRNDRNDFEKSSLSESQVNSNPLLQFKEWLEDAITSKVNEPYAFNLATVSENGRPSNRILYLRDFDDKGLVFYTNYLSKKGHSIEENPYGSVCFFWAELERQVRIEGRIVKSDKQLSDDYFSSRPRKSKLGAWASKQSQELDKYERLEERMNEFDSEFEGEVPRPEHWGGYVLEPFYYEFWQGRPSRLHDRIIFEKSNDSWEIKRLYP